MEWTERYEQHSEMFGQIKANVKSLLGDRQTGNVAWLEHRERGDADIDLCEDCAVVVKDWLCGITDKKPEGDLPVAWRTSDPDDIFICGGCGGYEEDNLRWCGSCGKILDVSLLGISDELDNFTEHPLNIQSFDDLAAYQMVLEASIDHEDEWERTLAVWENRVNGE